MAAYRFNPNDRWSHVTTSRGALLKQQLGTAVNNDQPVPGAASQAEGSTFFNSSIGPFRDYYPHHASDPHTGE